MDPDDGTELCIVMLSVAVESEHAKLVKLFILLGVTIAGRRNISDAKWWLIISGCKELNSETIYNLMIKN